MAKNWTVDVVRIHGGGLPEFVRAADKRLEQILKENCHGPYDESAIQIGLGFFVEGKVGAPIPYKGIRSEPLIGRSIGASIYIKSADWDGAPDSYYRFLWEHTEKAILVCAEKLLKKKIVVDLARLKSDLAAAKYQYLGNDASWSGAPLSVDEYAQDEQHPIVIQYRIIGHGNVQDHEKRVRIEKLVGDFLEANDLGYCDGGDIGSGTINVFCFVRAASDLPQRIVKLLRDSCLLEGATIAETVKGEERVVWPPDFRGEFQLMYP